MGDARGYLGKLKLKKGAHPRALLQDQEQKKKVV